MKPFSGNTVDEKVDEVCYFSDRQLRWHHNPVVLISILGKIAVLSMKIAVPQVLARLKTMGSGWSSGLASSYFLQEIAEQDTCQCDAAQRGRLLTG